MSVNARAWLQNTSHARVLHLFDEVCNLISDDERVLALVSEQIGDGPFSLVLPQVCFPIKIPDSAMIVCDKERLRIGDLAIEVRDARVWDPRPDWHKLRARKDRLLAGLPHLITTLEHAAPRDSLAGLVTRLPAPTSALAAAFHRRMQDPADKLVAGLRSGDASLSREGSMGLVGLGNGLTPAGDDWIVGSLLGTWIVWEERKTKRLADAVVQSAAGKTTPLSKAMIQAASHGECSAPWHDLLAALLAEDAGLIRAAAERIMAHGHTSGADALSGFVAVLREGAPERP